MDSPDKPRKTPWATLMVAPVPPVILYFFLMLRFMPHNGGDSGNPPPVVPLIYFYLLFALPAAYVAEAVLYLAAYRRTPQRLAPYVITAALVGAVVGTQGPKFMLSMPDGMMPPSAVVSAFVAGALSGALAGTLFLIGARLEDPAPKADPAGA